MKGIVIKKILKENKIIMADLARKMNISPQHLNNIFKTRDISSGRLTEISKHTGINLIGLLIRDEEETEKYLQMGIDHLMVEAREMTERNLKDEDFVKQLYGDASRLYEDKINELKKQLAKVEDEKAEYKKRLDDKEKQLNRYIDAAWDKEDENDSSETASHA